MNIFLTRHGQTQWNLMGKVQGHLDSPLTENGIKDAINLKNRLSDYKIDLCFTSDQNRAIHTSEIIMEDQEGSIIETSKLRELGVGNWEGMYYEDIKNKYPDEFQEYISNAHKYKPKNGGEEYENLQIRVQSFLEEIKLLEVDNILIVTHGVTYLMILSLMEGKGLESLSKRSVPVGGSLTKIHYNGKDFQIIYEADGRHLEKRD